jgi:hypothetical protein
MPVIGRIEWERHDAYHSRWREWTLTRLVVGGVDNFNLWLGGTLGRPSGVWVPIRFETAKEAVEFVRWIEESAPEYTQDTADVALTSEQKELL